jgi:hypothetical protein
MSEGARTMKAAKLDELLEKHDLGKTGGGNRGALEALVQEAYGIGWDEGERSRVENWQRHELPLGGDALEAVLSQLSPRDRRVVELRFGLGPDGKKYGRTLEQIGKELEISRERVRQILNTAITMMVSEERDE